MRDCYRRWLDETGLRPNYFCNPNEAFQQVLDDPGAADALRHPALKPLLNEAADA